MIKKTSKSIFWTFFLLISVLHLGTIRRDQDPIMNAQTDPISLKQKIEETKDGVKGAPAPSFEYYEKEDFLTRSPMEVAEEGVVPKAGENPLNEMREGQEKTFGIQEEALDQLLGEEEPKTDVSDEDDWWMEEEAQDSSQE